MKFVVYLIVVFTDTVETHTLLSVVPQASLYTSVMNVNGDSSVDQNYPDMYAMFMMTVFSVVTVITQLLKPDPTN